MASCCHNDGMNWSRVGNSIFFIGLMLLVVAAIIWSVSESSATPVALAIGALLVACMILGGWLWNRPVSVTSPQPVPLSQQPPRNKILAGVGGLALLLAMALQNREPDIRLRFLALALIAYGIAGAFEVYLDRQFPSAKSRWDALPALNKILLSTVVIIGAFAIAMIVMTRLFRPL